MPLCWITEISELTGLRDTGVSGREIKENSINHEFLLSDLAY
jgi:hypothetical protein